MAFVMVLSYSRQIFLRFCFDARMENLLRGHVAAFAARDGLPRVLLYDNLKSAVLERRGDAIRFHPTLLGFAGQASQTLLNRAAENGANLGAITTALINLLVRCGAASLQDAILDAMLRDVPHHSAVRLALERQRLQQGGEPPVAIILPPHVRDGDAPVRPHALETYDQLKDKPDEVIAHIGNISASDDNV